MLEATWRRPTSGAGGDRGESIVAVSGLSGLKTFERKSTSDRISEELRQMIIEGRLRPGEPLAETRIAELLDVSRAPVREALQQLVQQKLLVSARNRGVSVAAFTASDIWEIYDARCAIESHAAGRIIDGGPGTRARATDALRAVLDRLRIALKQGDRRKISAIDLEFHTTLVASAGNSRLDDAYSILSAQTLACINRLEIALPSGEELVDEHGVLIDALAAGERETLLKAINDHLTLAASHLTGSQPSSN
ncbi:GntR family transcriptional regulator [Promicromonospora soli]|uniref:GntR family transcriptional regulator n=2 Tax=Promicromonospora soli TaxID=2035533 RepID=A0A919FHD4_9MICO|nr:GntR family transcriptional regulator [Promicromonospora soli]